MISLGYSLKFRRLTKHICRASLWRRPGLLFTRLALTGDTFLAISRPSCYSLEQAHLGDVDGYAKHKHLLETSLPAFTLTNTEKAFESEVGGRHGTDPFSCVLRAWAKTEAAL